MMDVPSQRFSCWWSERSFFQDASGERTTVKGMYVPSGAMVRILLFVEGPN